MRRALTTAIILFSLLLMSSTAVLGSPTCTPLPLDPGTLLCTITKAADCHAIQDYP